MPIVSIRHLTMVGVIKLPVHSSCICTSPSPSVADDPPAAASVAPDAGAAAPPSAAPSVDASAAAVDSAAGAAGAGARRCISARYGSTASSSRILKKFFRETLPVAAEVEVATDDAVVVAEPFVGGPMIAIEVFCIVNVLSCCNVSLSAFKPC